MTFDELTTHLNLPVTDNQRLAAAFLESQGKRFCCEYGLENCEQMANDIAEDIALWEN